MKKFKKGFTFYEIIITLIIVAALSIIIVNNLFSTIDSGKETALKEIIISIEKTIQMEQNELLLLKNKTNNISDGDEDMLDELIQLEIIKEIDLGSVFKDVSKLTFEIRTITENNSEYLVYFFIDSSDEVDKAMIDKVTTDMNRKIF